MQSNQSPYLDELMGKASAPESNLAPFDVVVPPGTDPLEMAKKMTGQTQSPYLDELLISSPQAIAKPTLDTKSEVNLDAYNPEALFYKLAPKVPKAPEVKPPTSEESHGAALALNRLWSLAKNPYDVVKGAAEFVSSLPGFALGVGGAAWNLSRALGQGANLDQAYEAAAKGMEENSSRWNQTMTEPLGRLIEAPKTLGNRLAGAVTGKEIDPQKSDSSFVGELAMAPLTAVTAAAHAVADAKWLEDYPNVKGAIKFGGDVLGLLTIGRVYRGGSKEYAKDVEPIIEKAKAIEEKQKIIDTIPIEELKVAQNKVLEAEKIQLDLEAKKLQDKLDREKIAVEEAKAKGEDIKAIKETGEVPIPEVFGRMRIDQLTEQADKGVDGAKRELERRAIEEHDASLVDIEKEKKSVEPVNELEPTKPKPKKAKKKSIVEVDEIIDELPAPLKSDVHPFRDTDVEKVNETSKVLASALRSPTPDIEVFTTFLHNEVNRYLNGAKDVQIEKIKGKLNDLAGRAESFRNSFDRSDNYNEWVGRVRETAGWASKADRPKGEGPKLFSGVDPTEVIKIIKDIKDRLVKKYPRDSTLSSSGYVFDDGKVASLTNKIKGGYESVPHWESLYEGLTAFDAEIINNTLEIKKSKSNVLDQYLDKSGSIRYVRENENTISLELAKKPTPQQIDTIKNAIDRNGTIHIDFPDSSVSIKTGQLEAVVNKYFSDRLTGKRTDGGTQLNMMIPVNELPSRLKDLLKDLKIVGGAKEGIFRNKEIFDKTGFWLGKDGKWRYEIDDSVSKYHPPKATRDQYDAVGSVAVPLEDVYTNDKLFQAVPRLRYVVVKYDKSLKDAERSYNASTNTINMRKIGAKDVLTHEMQHGVSDAAKSRFRGSNVEAQHEILIIDLLREMKDIAKDSLVKNEVSVALNHFLNNRDKKAITPILKNAKEIAERNNPEDAANLKRIFEVSTDAKAFENYMKDPGEMESRLTTTRMEMTAEQRKAEPPWETLEKMLGEEFGMAEADVKASHTLYSGIDPTLIKKIISATKETISKYGKEKRIRIEESKVPEPYRPNVKGTNEWMDSFDDARDAKRFDTQHFLNRLAFRSYRAIHEQRGQLRRDLMKYGKEGYKAVQYIDAEQASSGLADRMYYEMKTEAFRDVPSHLTKAVDAVDLVNRLTDIYGYKTSGEFIAPKGMSPANTANVKVLLDHYLKMTPEERAKAESASKVLSDHVKKWVDEMVEVGLKSADEGEVLKSHKYRKIKSLTVQGLYDQKIGQGIMLGDRLVRSTDSGIDFLANDPITLLETDHRILYKETANRMAGRIMAQRTKNALRDFDAEYLENPFVRFRENDPSTVNAEGKSKVENRPIPEGWVRDYYFKEGKLHTYYLDPDFALQLLGSGPHMSFDLSRVLRNFFGVNLTRAMTVSTSALWATTRGLTMDLAHTFFSARRVKEVDGVTKPIDVEYERLYSRMAPKFLGQIGTDMAETFSDVMHRGPMTGAYEKNGGVIPFLSMREQHYLGRGSAPPSVYNRTMDALSWWGQSMEMWNRVAVMHRQMKTLADRKGITLEEAYKDRDLTMEATNVAVERLPYRQGGWLPKELDKIIGPFISAGYNASRTFLRGAKENPVDFAARLSNIAIPTVAMTIGLAMFAEEVDRDIPESYHVGSIVVPLPFDTFSFLDENGDKRYSLLKIPVDPTVASFYNIFRLSTKKALFEAGMIKNEPDYKAITDSITRSLPVDSPMGPTVSAWMAYFGNVNPWRMNKVVNETVEFPRSNVEGMDKPEKYSQLAKDIANATGTSAPRLEAAARNFGFPNNEYAWLFGRLYDKSMSDIDPKIKEEHLAQSMAKIPGFKNLFAITVPRSYRSENRVEMSEDETYVRMVRNNKLAADAKAFYWKGVGREGEIDKYIDSFDDKQVRESMEQKRKFIENIKALPHRDSWVYNFNKSPEYKAEDYYKIWKTESSDKERAALNRELDILEGAGYVSKESSSRFWQKFDELVIGGK